MPKVSDPWRLITYEAMDCLLQIDLQFDLLGVLSALAVAEVTLPRTAPFLTVGLSGRGELCLANLIGCIYLTGCIYLISRVRLFNRVHLFN